MFSVDFMLINFISNTGIINCMKFHVLEQTHMIQTDTTFKSKGITSNLLYYHENTWTNKRETTKIAKSASLYNTVNNFNI